MTVETTASRVQYSTNGTTGPWTVPFPFLQNEDLEVVYTTADGTQQTLNLDANYSVSGAGGESGTVSTVIGYPAGGLITILRNVEPLQESDYVDGDPFPAETLERDLDRLTMLAQQTKEVSARAVTVPPSESGYELPPAVQRKGKLLGFDVITGAFLLVTATVGSILDFAIQLASSIGSSLIGFIQRGANAVQRTLQSKARDFVSVTDYGVVLDGVTENSIAFQKAADDAKILGVDLHLPGGKCYINGVVTLPDKVSLWGTGKSSSELQFGPAGALKVTGTNLTSGASGHLSIRGIGITNQGGGPTYALQLTYATRVLLSDCVVYNTGIQLSAFSYINIENCDLFGGKLVGDHPTVNEISEALKISRCNGSSFGIDVKDTADVHISLTHLLGPTSQIQVQRGEQNSAFYPPVQISNCIVDSGDDEGIYLIGVAPRISDTFVSSGRTNLKSGVRLNDCVEGSLIGVTGRFCGNHGLHIGFSKQIKVLGCHFDDNKVSGIRLGDSSNITIEGSTAINQPAWFGGNYPQVNGITDEPSNCTNITCIGNQVSGNTSVQIYLPSVTNIIHSNSGYNEGRLTCDSWRNNTDNAASLGTASARWSVVYAATGTINTSDEREKTPIEPLTEAHRRIALFLKGKIGVFRFKDAIEQKGDGARYHFGIGAQTVAAAFQAEGLDPHQYALFCYDEWPSEGGRPAGNRYGVRYDELAMFILAAI